MKSDEILDYKHPEVLWVVEDRIWSSGTMDCTVVGVFTTLRKAMTACTPKNASCCKKDPSNNSWFAVYVLKLDSDEVCPRLPELIDNYGHTPFLVFSPHGKRLETQPSRRDD